MKNIARLLIPIFGFNFLFSNLFIVPVEAMSAPQTTAWSQTVEVESGEYIFQSDREFNAFYIKVLSGEDSNYKVWMDDNLENIADKKTDDNSWNRLYAQDPDEPNELFNVNPTHELRIYAEAAGTLSLNFINTSPGETATISPCLIAQNWDFADFKKNGIDIITRSEWGADETLRYASEEAKDEAIDDDEIEYYQTYANELAITKVVKKENNKYLIWPYQYPNKIRKVIIHHTAGTTNLNDPAAVMRSIYYYHTVSHGWGDIGYNFVIDTKGNIYEGRAGGDMVVGAHASSANTGSVGISVMGDYHTVMEVPDAVEKSLIKLITYLTQKYDINPAGVESFRGMSLPNIIGHRDVGSTACPGDHLYALLPEIRSAVMNNGTVDWASGKEYSFTISGKLPYLDINPTQEKVVAIKLKNTGTSTWSTGTKLVPIDTSNEISATISASELLEPEVSPNEIGTFMTTVKAGVDSGIQTVNLSLQINGTGLTVQQFPIPVRVAQPTFDYTLVKATWPKTQLQVGDTTRAYIVLKNTSNFTWGKRGKTEVRLSTLDKGRRSLFIAKDSSGKRKADDEVSYDPTLLAPMFEESVAPGDNAHFEISFTAPEKFGEFVERFTLQAPKLGWFPDKGMQFTLNVNPPQAKAVIAKAPEQTAFKVLPGERVMLKFELRNTGDSAWKANQIEFVSSNDYIPVTDTYYNGTVAVGAKASFEVDVQAPYKAGNFFTNLKLTTGFADAPDFVVDPGIGVSFEVTEAPVLGATLVGSNTYTLEMNPWEERTIRVKYKNTGNADWHAVGGKFWQTVTMLGTYAPKNRTSNFWNSNWIKATRGAVLREGTVGVGKIGSFDITLRAPGQLGTYVESFNPVVDWIGWMSGEPVTFNINVKSGAVNSNVVNIENTTTTPVATDTTTNNSTPTTKPTTTKPTTTPTTSSTSANTTTPTNTISSSATQISDLKPMRVLLSFDSSSFQITSDKAFQIKTLDGTLLKEYRAGDVANLANGTFENKKYDGLRFEGGIIEIKNWDHSPSWNKNLNDNRFRNALEVRKYKNNWIVLNELPLEDYMYGLAEVIESEPIEKHKALLVAARTYALWYLTEENKFNDDAPYNASDDPNVFQKYLGYGYELRAPMHMRAVNATYGQVITYKGKVVKTPYFSSSDGRTRSAKEVWGWTNTPYLVSVKDPYCDGMKLNGHGVGMSGQGATGAANEGKGYEEILKYYYTGIEIKKLY